MESASKASNTQSGITLQKSPIFSLRSLPTGYCERHTIRSGWMPMRLSSLTLCCVVLSSIHRMRLCTDKRYMAIEYIFPSYPAASCLIASRKGSPSISPTVPPISAITTSLSSPTLSILSCISFVM